MVVIDVALPIDPNRAEDLRAAINLTAAEAEIALQIANGTSREHVARLRGSTVGTVAIQLKSILQKAGVRREAELVALINQLLRR
jgi:DNA-binding CsgD family transcriptional regulator